MACGGPNFLRQKQNSMLAYYLSNVTQIFELFKSCFVTFYCTSEDTNPIGEVPYFFFYSNFGILKCEKDSVCTVSEQFIWFYHTEMLLLC